MNGYSDVNGDSGVNGDSDVVLNGRVVWMKVAM